jgi:transcriptional regulator with XRE-family HTH domain
MLPEEGRLQGQGVRVRVQAVSGLGAAIRKRRKACGWSRKRFSSLLGISRGTILNWESDITEPCVSELVGICDAFKCCVQELLNEAAQ